MTLTSDRTNLRGGLKVRPYTALDKEICLVDDHGDVLIKIDNDNPRVAKLLLEQIEPWVRPGLWCDPEGWLKDAEERYGPEPGGVMAISPELLSPPPTIDDLRPGQTDAKLRNVTFSVPLETLTYPHEGHIVVRDRWWSAVKGQPVFYVSPYGDLTGQYNKDKAVSLHLSKKLGYDEQPVFIAIAYVPADKNE